MEVRPLTLKEANAYVAQMHRHSKPVTGHKWSIGCYDKGKLVGVAICGRPVSRMLDDGMTIEANRVCTDGTKNACSFLYGACARIAKELGYNKIVTYILETEQGTTLKASGWKQATLASGGGSWDSPTRPREDTQITLFGEVKKYETCKKIRWEKQLRRESNASAKPV